VGICVEAVDLGAAGARGQAYRAADQADAEDRQPSWRLRRD
jgi:hypothetical protein